MDKERASLGITDYIIFALMLLISSSIGVIFRFSGGKQKTTDEYLLAGRNMSILPVAFSLMATFLSAISVIGMPSEVYKFGIHMVYVNIGTIIAIVISSYFFLPVYFQMQVSTAYEYLERRFGKLTRTACSFIFIVQMILYMSVVLYAPALSLSAVTNLSTWVSVISLSTVCTFYCTLGGMKAVLWTDLFQTMLMFTGILCVCIKGFINLGGIEPALKTAYDGGRIFVSGFGFDLEVRYTMWNLIILGFCVSVSHFSANQIQVQRLLTVKNISRSRRALILSMPISCSFHLLTCVAGIVVYAHFANCDPMTSPNRPITQADQLLPYFIVSTMNQYPGLAGLCICGIFSASLSSVSSGINSLTAVTMQDIVRPLLKITDNSEEKASCIAKVLTLFYGLLMMAFTFMVSALENVTYAAMTVMGVLGGPVFGVFFLGMMTQRTNEKGAILGLILSSIFTIWICLGASANGTSMKQLPVSVQGCILNEVLNATMFPYTTSSSFNFTDELTTVMSPLGNNRTVLPSQSSYEHGFSLYKISYVWFTPIALCTSIIIGYLSSIVFNTINGSTECVPTHYLSPVLRYFLEEKASNSEINLTNISGQLEHQLFTELDTRAGGKHPMPVEHSSNTQNTST